MKNTYDILIVGAGLGGLECATILSKKGFKVCVLEKNKHIGGTLQNFQLDGCTFSSGMHYLGSLDNGQILHRLFSYLGIHSGLKLKRMDENVFDRFIIGENLIDYPIGWESFEERMNSYFPTENKAIREYTRLIKTVSSSQAIYNLHPPENYDIRLNPYLKEGIYPAIKKITSNTKLQNALTALNFVYAGDKNTSSLYTHALINNYYIQSAYRLIGGSDQVAGLLANKIKNNGGSILTKTKVEELVFKGDKLAGVRVNDGEIIFGNKIISNVHPSVTLELVPAGKIRKSYRKRISSIKNTISVFGLHLKLKRDRIPYINHNLHVYKSRDVWPVSSYDKEKWPSYLYIYTPATDAGSIFTDCLSIYSYMRFEEVQDWASMPAGQRGDSYHVWKSAKADQLIDEASKQIPNLKENTESWIAVTPLTYRDYIGSPGGAMYGTLRDYHSPMNSYIFPRTKIPNLYFTGQNINLHGMLGVSISALLTCGEILGINEIMNEINNGRA